MPVFQGFCAPRGTTPAAPSPSPLTSDPPASRFFATPGIRQHYTPHPSPALHLSVTPETRLVLGSPATSRQICRAQHFIVVEKRTREKGYKARHYATRIFRGKIVCAIVPQAELCYTALDFEVANFDLRRFRHEQSINRIPRVCKCRRA